MTLVCLGNVITVFALVDEGIFDKIVIPTLLVPTPPWRICCNISMAMWAFDAEKSLVQEIEIQAEGPSNGDDSGDPCIKKPR